MTVWAIISTVHRSSAFQTGSKSHSGDTICILPITTAATSGWHTATTFWAHGPCTEMAYCHSTTRSLPGTWPRPTLSWITHSARFVCITTAQTLPVAVEG